MDIGSYLEETRMWRGYNNYQRYREEDGYELLEYFKIEPDRSGLGVRIWVDDGHSYLVHRHPMWLYAEIQNKLVPISICRYPQVMLPECKEYDIEMIRQFIVDNLDGIIKLANEEIVNINFGNNIQHSEHSNEYSLEDMLDKPQDWKSYYIENNIEFDEEFHDYE